MLHVLNQDFRFIEKLANFVEALILDRLLWYVK